MYMKIQHKDGKKIVAICDRDLIGKTLDDGEICIDLDKYREFYVGEISSADEVKNALISFSSANIVGKKAVNVALNNGLVGKKDVMYINNTPYVQIYCR